MRTTTAAALLVLLLAGCGPIRIKATPDTYSVPLNNAPLRVPQSLTLVNGYPNETKVSVPRESSRSDRKDLETDLQQLTGAAIEMLSRHLGKLGFDTTGAAGKIVTLQVSDLRVKDVEERTVPTVTAFITLRYRLGDGTEGVLKGEYGRQWGSSQRIFDGALVRAVTALLNDYGFVTYVNR